ncbi:hypothetical protein [Tardiphaga sp.]|uniref:hypothetical protein n=1 Tax=Tardiphaga sp. TaxID=1926292 RepID=UPI0037D9E975
MSEGEGGGGNNPPVVHPPDNLPNPLQQIEDQVSSHAITGEQAISQIASLIGSQPDHAMQAIAGAEIATLIARGFIDATAAMADLHEAVTQTHSLTGVQAAGILGGVIQAQYTMLGDYPALAPAAATEISNLIGDHALTADQAVTTLAALAGQDQYLNWGLMNQIANMAQQYAMPAADIVADVTAAVDDHDLTGLQAIAVLTALTTYLPLTGTAPYVDLAGHAIGDLASTHNIDPDDIRTVLNDNIFGTDTRLPGLFLSMVEANESLAEMAGGILAQRMAGDIFSWTPVMNQFKAAVADFGIASDDAIALLIGVAHGNRTAWAAELIAQLVVQTHVFSMTEVMTGIHNGAETTAMADGAVALLYGLATNGGYGPTFAPTAEAELVALIESGKITAAQAATDLLANATASRSLEMLMMVGTANVPDAADAVTAAVQSLVSTYGGVAVVHGLVGLVGGTASIYYDPAIGPIVFDQVSALVASGALTVHEAIETLADVATSTIRASGREAIADAIVALAAAAVPPLSAAQIMADVMTVRPAASSDNTILLLAFLAGHNHDLAAAAGGALAGMLDPNDWPVSQPSFVVGSVTNWIGSLSTLSVEAAVALLSAAVGNGQTAIPADIAGAGLSWLVTNENIAPVAITDAIHGSTVSGLTTGALALVMLAHFASSAGSTAQIAINNEIRALVTGTTPLLQRGHAVDILNDIRDAAQTANNAAFVAILDSQLAVLASGDPATAIFNGLNSTTNFADLETAASQLAALIASGESPVTSIMASIDLAYTNAVLTAPQVAQLLINIASHGDAATQTAAGAEFAKIVADAGVAIFVPAGQMTLDLSTAILSCLGIGLGGKPESAAPTVAHAMNADAALTFVIGALGASTTTEPVRSAFWLATQTLLNGNWSGVPILFQQMPLAMSGTVAASISDIASSHAMSGAELIRAVFVMTGLPQFNAPQQLQSLIGNAQVSMTDVHSAIVSGWWQSDNAIQVLAGISSTPAVMTELQSLISGGTVTAADFVNSLHLGLLAGWNATAVSVENYVRVLSVLASSSDAAVQTAVVNELATAFHNGQISVNSLDAVLDAAGVNQASLVERVLVAYDGYAFGPLVSVGLITLDHALVVLQQAGELYDAVLRAVTANTYDVALLTAGLVEMLAHGDLSAAAAKQISLQFSYQGNLALATMAGTLLAAVVADGSVTAGLLLDEVRLAANKNAHVLQGSEGIGIVQMTYLLNSFIAHGDPASAVAAAELARTLAHPAYGFFASPATAFSFVIAAAANSNASTLPQLASMLKGMIENITVAFADVTDALDGLPATTALGLYLNIAQRSVTNGTLLHDALGEISAMVPGRISASAAVLALNGMLSNAAGMLDAPTYAVLSQAVGAEISAIAAANPGTDVLSGIADAIRSGTLTGLQAAQLLLGMITGNTVQPDVAATINTLIADNLMTAQQLILSAQTIGQATSQPASELLDTYIKLAAISPAVMLAAGAMIGSMIYTGAINGVVAIGEINSAIGSVLTMNEAVALFASVAATHESQVGTVNSPIAAQLSVLLNANVLSAQQLRDAVTGAVHDGSATIERAFALYAMLAKSYPERHDLVVDGMTDLLTANPGAQGMSPFSAIGIAFSGAADLGIPLALDLAVKNLTTLQLPFASFIAGLIVPDASPVTAGKMHVSDAFAFIQNAYAQGVITPNAPGTITAAQELKLLTGLFAAGAGPGTGASLLPLVHDELVAMIRGFRVSDVAVAVALEAVGESSAQIQAAVNLEIDALEDEIGPQMRINVAAETGADMATVGSELTAIIAAGGSNAEQVMSFIVAAVTAGNLTTSQALTMIASALAHTTSNGIYLVGPTNATNWIMSSVYALGVLADRGLSADAIGSAIEGISAYGNATISPTNGVAILAALAARDALQDSAATHIAGILASNGPTFTMWMAVGAVVDSISLASNGLHADDAARLLIKVAAAIDTPAAFSEMAAMLGNQSVPTQIPPAMVVETVEALLQSGALSAQQALSFLAPYGVLAPSAAGHAIGDLIANHQITITAFAAVVHGGLFQTSTAIDGSTPASLRGTGEIHFSTAITLLAAMTSRTADAIDMLITIVTADTTSVWSIIETALTTAATGPLSAQEAVRALTLLALDPAAASAFGGNFAARVASDVNTLVIANAITTASAIAQIVLIGTQSEELADLAVQVVKGLIGNGPATGPDAIIGAIGYGITAVQAIDLLTQLSTSTSVNLLSHIRTDFAYLISSGMLTGADVLGALHDACIDHGLGVAQEMALLAGIYSDGNGNAAVEAAVAHQIDALITNGRLTLAQAIDAIALATYALSSTFPTVFQDQASYLAGGLQSGDAAALLARIATISSNPTALATVADAIASLVAGNKLDLTAAISGIDAAVATGTLDAARTVALLASIPLTASDVIHTAVGGEIAALVAAHRLTIDQAVATLVAMAHQGSVTQQIQAGAALGLAIAQNATDLPSAISGVLAAVQAQALTASQAVALLAGMTANTGAGVTAAIGNAISALIGQGISEANAMSLLMTVAGCGMAAIETGAAAIMIGLTTDGGLVTQAVDAAFTSGALSAVAAIRLLLGLADNGDTATQAAAGLVVGRIVQVTGSISALAVQLAASTLSQSEAVVLLTGAIAGASTSALQTQMAALIQTQVTNGTITIAQVLAVIDGAVGHGLNAAQVLTALVHLEEAGDSAMRVAILAQVAALVTNHLIDAAGAASALLAAAHHGSTALQSLVGGMLATLADRGLLTDQQVSEAISTATSLVTSEKLGVLIGMSVNGSAAAQAASGVGILTLVHSGQVDAQAVAALIDNAARQNVISPERALQVALNIAAAATADIGAGATGLALALDKYTRSQMLGEVVSVTTSLMTNGGSVQATLLAMAGHSVAMAETVGRALATMWAADQTTASPVVRSFTAWVPLLADAVANQVMSREEALPFALAGSIGDYAQTLMTGLVRAGVLTAVEAVQVLASAAVRYGFGDGANPELAYNGITGPDPELANTAIRQLQALMTGANSVPALVSPAAAMNEIVSLAAAHALSGQQAASLIANLVGRLAVSDALVAASAIGALVTQQLIVNESAMHAVAWAVGATSGLTQGQANLIYASMALSSDPAVQQIAVWTFNFGDARLAQAFHGVTTNPIFTSDQALAIITTIAAGLTMSGLQNDAVVASALSGEILAMVTAHQITADRAVIVLSGLAATSVAHLGYLGTELNVLISANVISFAQVVTILTGSALSADQIVTALVGLASANTAMDAQVLNQIGSMIRSGAIGGSQAMDDVAHAPFAIALRLLTGFATEGTAIIDAAATALAGLLSQPIGANNIHNFYALALANLTPVAAAGWIASVGAHGDAAVQSYVDSRLRNDVQYNGGLSAATNMSTLLTRYLIEFAPTALVQYYIGQIIGRMINPAMLESFNSLVPPAILAREVMSTVDRAIKGTESWKDAVTTPGSRPEDQKTVSSNTAALTLLGLVNATTNASAQAAADADLKLLSSSIDGQLLTAIAQVMAPQQALTQFVTMLQNGWVSVGLVGEQLADMVAHGSLTAQQVLDALAPLDANQQLAVVTNILAHNGTTESAFVSSFAALTLLVWGVAPTSQVYTAMHDALTQVVPDFVGLVRGTTSAANAINDIKAIATSTGVSVDLLLLSVYQSVAQNIDTKGLPVSSNAALTAIGTEIYNHIVNGSAAHAVAEIVLGGSLSLADAAGLMRELGTTATIPPTATALAVMNGEMSVWYADAHFPGWNTTWQQEAFTITNAVGMMQAEVASAQAIEAVLSGHMTGDEAVDAILRAGGGSEYAKDMGLLALAHGLEDHAAGDAALDAVRAEIGSRISGESTADSLVTMASRGWLSEADAVEMLRDQIAVATEGLPATEASILECIALARLDLSASGQIDPHATPEQIMMHGGPTSSGIQQLLETADAAKLLTGLGALQVAGGATSYDLGAGLALAQHVTQVLVDQMMAEHARAGTSPSGSGSSIDIFANMPPAVQQIIMCAEMASQYFTIGLSYAPVALDAIERAWAPARDIHYLTSDPASVQKWVDLGVDLAVGGVPAAGIFNAAGAGLPGWASGLQSAMLNEAFGAGAGGVFTGVTIASNVAVIVLGIPAVQNGMHDGGMTLATMQTLANTCSLISGIISGSVHAAANTVLNLAEGTFDTFKAAVTGGDVGAAAEELGRELFQHVTGFSLDGISGVGEAAGRAFVDLMSGNPDNLADDARALGQAALDMLESNKLVQVVDAQFDKFLDKMAETLRLDAEAALMAMWLMGLTF